MSVAEKVVLIITLAALAIGVVSVVVGKVVDFWDRVKGLEVETPPAPADRPSSASGSQWVEPVKIPDTSQAEPIELPVRDPPDEPVFYSHKMSRKELTILLAAQRDGEGQYRFSANKIAEFVGGTGAEVKGWVADVRGRKEPAAATLRRPANGWGKAS